MNERASIRLYSSITFFKKVLSFYQKALTQNFNLCLFSLVISPTLISVKLFVYMRNFVDSVVDKGLEKRMENREIPENRPREKRKHLFRIDNCVIMELRNLSYTCRLLNRYLNIG